MPHPVLGRPDGCPGLLTRYVEAREEDEAGLIEAIWEFVREDAERQKLDPRSYLARLVVKGYVAENAMAEFQQSDEFNDQLARARERFLAHIRKHAQAKGE